MILCDVWSRYCGLAQDRKRADKPVEVSGRVGGGALKGFELFVRQRTKQPIYGLNAPGRETEAVLRPDRMGGTGRYDIGSPNMVCLRANISTTTAAAVTVIVGVSGQGVWGFNHELERHRPLKNAV